MEVLRQLFESLGFSKVATFIASGNVVFEATTKNVKSLEKRIEKRLEEAWVMKWLHSSGPRQS